MSSPEMVTRVFDGAKAVVDCASSITNAAINTYDLIDQLGKDPNQVGQPSYLYSRRSLGGNVGDVPQQKMLPYQAPRYPWANDRYNQFYVGQTQVGYPGISNQDYGRRSFANAFASQQSNMFRSMQTPDVRAWANPWGR